jgi:hypothetical protein
MQVPMMAAFDDEQLAPGQIKIVVVFRHRLGSSELRRRNQIRFPKTLL